MPERFSGKELSERLRQVLDELATVCDEIMITHLDETEDERPAEDEPKPH